MIEDPIRDDMAQELNRAIVRAGGDPFNPPVAGPYPPVTSAWKEYQRRGGSVYTDPEAFVNDLVQRVTEV